MLALGHIGAFVVVAAVVIVTPGPDTALTIRNALRGGRRGGILTSAGVASGQATWALTARSASYRNSPATAAIRSPRCSPSVSSSR